MRSAQRGSEIEFAHQLAKEISRLRIQCLGDREEFRDIDLALIALDHADDRVRNSGRSGCSSWVNRGPMGSVGNCRKIY